MALEETKGGWIPVHAVRFNEDGSISMLGSHINPARLGSGARFKALTRELEAKGARTPKALAAWIGRKKYGAKRFARLSARGRNPKVGGVKFILKKLRINRSGYEQSSRPGGGRYYGVGAPVYHYEDYETGEISGEFRAHSKQDAIEKLKSIVGGKI